MTVREQKAVEIADKFRIVETAGKWMVPSQSGKGKYAVRVVGHSSDCTCPDFELRREACKHMLAVRHVIQREQNADWSVTVTETFEVTQRATYPQNWKAYNDAQTTEKDHFQILLADLCSNLTSTPQEGRGQRRLPVSDALFAAIFKMIEQSALPLQAVEKDFAVDSSGFSTSKFVRWFDHKYGTEKLMHEWVKVHVMCGVKTNIVTAVEIKGRHASDAQFLPPLLETTAKNFHVSEVSGDKGYLSVDNARAVAKVGATPFIAFRSNSTGAGNKNGGLAYREMFHYFNFRPDEFLRHYHKRSNVETTFSMMKRKFGDSLRSKTDTAMVNESLCKILCHNLVVLIHEINELGITPTFRWAETTVAQQNDTN